MEYKPQNEINTALEKFLQGSMTRKKYEKIARMYKPIQD
jgi:hypothetical protein